MSEFEILGIAVALSVDAVIVALCWSAAQRAIRWSDVTKFALTFGCFQALMPLLGWFAGDVLFTYINAWDHWLAFLMLAGVAVSMLKEAFEDDEEETPCCGHCEGKKEQGISFYRLMILAVATSLDALAIGFSFAMVNLPIVMPIVVIGIVCAILTAVAVSMGKALSEKCTRHAKKLSIAGALVLLAIGVRILIEHGVFG